MLSADPFVLTFQKWIEVFMRSNVSSLVHFTKATGLSMSQVGALFNVGHTGSGVSDIGDDLGVTKAAASQFLQDLVEKGLILRSEDPEDRRAKHIVLTDKGRSILQEIMHQRQGQLETLAQSLSPEEKEEVTAALNILIDKIRTLEEMPELQR